MFSLICTRINGWVNNCEAGDLRRQPVHYDIIVMDCPGAGEVILKDMGKSTDTELQLNKT